LSVFFSLDKVWVVVEGEGVIKTGAGGGTGKREGMRVIERERRRGREVGEEIYREGMSRRETERNCVRETYEHLSRERET